MRQRRTAPALTHALVALPLNAFLFGIMGPLIAQSLPDKHRTPPDPWTACQQPVYASTTVSPLRPPAFRTTTWTPMGPATLSSNNLNGNVSGRIAGIAAHPADPMTIYVAAGGGGVWKTIDGGATWMPLTDTQATLSMGAIAVAPSNPNIIYAGTGEGNGGNSNYGRGILVSADGGNKWILRPGPLAALDRHTVSQIAIDPSDPHTAYAAVGDDSNNNGYGNTGIWKTTAGGFTWTNTTATIDSLDSLSSIQIDPDNPSTLYAPLGNKLRYL